MKTFSLNPDPMEFWGSLTPEVVKSVNPEWLSEMSVQIIERRGSLGERYEFFTAFGEEANARKIPQLNAFAAACERNTILNKGKHEVEVVDEADAADGEMPKHAVFSSVHQYIEDNYDKIVDDDAIATDIKEMLEIRDYIRIEKQVDFFTLIKIAYGGLSREVKTKKLETLRAEVAAKRIRELCDEFSITEKFMEFMRLPNALECVLSYT